MLILVREGHVFYSMMMMRVMSFQVIHSVYVALQSLQNKHRHQIRALARASRCCWMERETQVHVYCIHLRSSSSLVDYYMRVHIFYLVGENYFSQ